jgi:hypothetical protein
VITADEFVAMRSEKGKLAEAAIDAAIKAASEEGTTIVELDADLEWMGGFNQVAVAYRRAGWKVSHRSESMKVVLRFEVA